MACVSSSSCVQLQLVGGALRADAIISPDSQNIVSAQADGLFAFCQRGPMARMYALNGSSGVTGSVASASTAAIAFNQLSYDVSNDPYGRLAGSADVANNRFVCRRNGHYQVGCSVTWQNMPAAGRMNLSMLWNGILLAAHECTINTVIGDLPLTVQSIVQFTIGDTITFQVSNNSGNTRSLYNPFPPYGHMAWLNFIRS